MSNKEYAKIKAKQAAQLDFSKGLDCDSARHMAQKGSAWDSWYCKEYARLRLNKQYPTIG